MVIPIGHYRCNSVSFACIHLITIIFRQSILDHGHEHPALVKQGLLCLAEDCTENILGIKCYYSQVKVKAELYMWYISVNKWIKVRLKTPSTYRHGGECKEEWREAGLAYPLCCLFALQWPLLTVDPLWSLCATGQGYLYWPVVQATVVTGWWCGVSGEKRRKKRDRT